MNAADFFLSTPEITLPHTVPGSDGLIVIEHLHVGCNGCNARLDLLHGLITDHNTCAEFKVAGVCHSCRVVTGSLSRVYGDGRVLQQTTQGWSEQKVIPVRWMRFCAFISRLFTLGAAP
jgi:hypothetical protein